MSHYPETTPASGPVSSDPPMPGGLVLDLSHAGTTINPLNPAPRHIGDTARIHLATEGES